MLALWLQFCALNLDFTTVYFDGIFLHAHLQWETL